MRTHATPQTELSCACPSRMRIRLSASCVTAASLAIFGLLVSQPQSAGAVSAAQNSTAPATPAHKPSSTHKSSSHTKKAVEPAPEFTPPPVPPAPKLPDWPANANPAAASVVWDSHGLLVAASNSSLSQILKEISLETGIKVEGVNKDQRIFGTYGPAPARDVLAQLLDGTNYDVLMIGDQGQGTPRRVVLTDRSGSAVPAHNANPNQPADQDAGAEEEAQQPDEPQPEEPQPPQAQPPPNVAPGVPMRTQQQLIEEMQERQRQLQQQQQQNQNPQ